MVGQDLEEVRESRLWPVGQRRGVIVTTTHTPSGLGPGRHPPPRHRVPDQGIEGSLTRRFGGVDGGQGEGGGEARRARAARRAGRAIQRRHQRVPEGRPHLQFRVLNGQGQGQVGGRGHAHVAGGSEGEEAARGTEAHARGVGC